MQDPEFEILEKRLDKLQKQVDDNENVISNIWFLFKNLYIHSFKKIGTLKIPKRAIAGICTSLFFSLLNFLLRLFDIDISWTTPLSLTGFIGDFTMPNEFNPLSWVNPDYMFLIPILLLAGLILKHRTTLANEKIIFYLFYLAAIICSIWGFLISQNSGFSRLFDAIFRAGKAQGFLVTASTVAIYDAKHMRKKYKKKKSLLKNQKIKQMELLKTIQEEEV